MIIPILQMTKQRRKEVSKFAQGQRADPGVPPPRGSALGLRRGSTPSCRVAGPLGPGEQESTCTVEGEGPGMSKAEHEAEGPEHTFLPLIGSS